MIEPSKRRAEDRRRFPGRLRLAGLRRPVDRRRDPDIMTFQTPFGGVALTGRAPALHAGGWRFESARLHHSEESPAPRDSVCEFRGSGRLGIRPVRASATRGKGPDVRTGGMRARSLPGTSQGAEGGPLRFSSARPAAMPPYMPPPAPCNTRSTTFLIPFLST
jgi:hypothetical protein